MFSCIVDEACQCIEMSILIPLRLKVESCILVGDPKQLPATTFLKGPCANHFERSIFERFESANYPVHMLRTQYRMNPEICKFPSKHFYQGKLMDADRVKGKYCKAFFHENAEYHFLSIFLLISSFLPFYFWDMPGVETLYEIDTSISNEGEALFVVDHIKKLLKFISSMGKLIFYLHLVEQHSSLLKNIGVITPYKAQQQLVVSLLKKEFGDMGGNIEVDTVISFITLTLYFRLMLFKAEKKMLL